jgi:hypothetical protein
MAFARYPNEKVFLDYRDPLLKVTGAVTGDAGTARVRRALAAE